MNGRGLASVIVAVAGLLLALYIMVSVLTGGGNVIGNLYRYLLVAGFVVGLLAPRWAFLALILMCGYIDVLKKILVAGQFLNFYDLFFVLGTPPVTLLGICVNLAISLGPGKLPATKRNVSFFIAAVTVVGLFSGLGIARIGVQLVTLKLLANSAAYFALIFVVPLLYPRLEDVFRLISKIVLCMIPAAIHGLWHYKFGLFQFEEMYMFSGLSANAMYVRSGEGIFGPFSSQGTLSATMSMCAVLSLLPFFAPKVFREHKGLMSRKWAVALFLLFFSAALFSLKRGPILIIPGAIAAYIVLGRKWMIIASYIVAPIMLTVLVLTSEMIADKLPEWQGHIYDSVDLGSANRLTRIRTLNARLRDFSLLADPENLTPFGAELAEKEGFGTHAGFVGAIIRYGWVPLIAALGVLAPILILFHKRVLRDAGTREGFATRFGAAMALALYVTPAVGFGSSMAFPNPFFIAFFIAVFANFAFFRLRDQGPRRKEERARRFGPTMSSGLVRRDRGLTPG